RLLRWVGGPGWGIARGQTAQRSPPPRGKTEANKTAVLGFFVFCGVFFGGVGGLGGLGFVLGLVCVCCWCCCCCGGGVCWRCCAGW
ncbi:hypothetical protein, partial [Pseudomonas syringae group genomosp. 7]|uniref:hypothetical protein n=1 Tax=Pseudomonas syringae group genomosp. 7 TaxID=251699 RepID=UPI00376F9430